MVKVKTPILIYIITISVIALGVIGFGIAVVVDGCDLGYILIAIGAGALSCNLCCLLISIDRPSKSDIYFKEEAKKFVAESKAKQLTEDELTELDDIEEELSEATDNEEF